jgi:NADH-quinone oxidoreductase subunit J
LIESGIILFYRSGESGLLPSFGSLASDFGSPVAVGELLFSSYLLPFEVTSILLLIAMIGAIVLTRSEKG